MDEVNADIMHYIPSFIYGKENYKVSTQAY